MPNSMELRRQAMAKDASVRTTIDMRNLQTLNDVWDRGVQLFGARLEALEVPSSSEVLEARIDEVIIPMAYRFWDEIISEAIIRVWGVSRVTNGRLRYNSDQFVSAIFRFAARPRLNR